MQFSLLALLLFMTVASLMLFWLSRPRKVAVTSLIHVNSSPSTLTTKVGLREWEIVQRTQLAFIRDPTVLQLAVSDPKIAKLPLMSRQADPVKWVQQRLEPQFQQNSEILSLRLAVAEKDASDAQALLGAIVRVYLQAATADEQQKWQAELQDHQAEYDGLSAAIEKQSKEIAKMRAERGPDDPEARLLQIEADRKVDAAATLKAEIDSASAKLNLPPRVRLIQPPVVVK